MLDGGYTRMSVLCTWAAYSPVLLCVMLTDGGKAIPILFARIFLRCLLGTPKWHIKCSHVFVGLRPRKMLLLTRQVKVGQRLLFKGERLAGLPHVRYTDGVSYVPTCFFRHPHLTPPAFEGLEGIIDWVVREQINHFKFAQENVSLLYICT